MTYFSAPNLYTAAGVLSSISNLTKHFSVFCFKLILAIWYQRFYNSNLGKLKFILVSHYSLAKSEICQPLCFILNGNYSASIMTSLGSTQYRNKNWQITKYHVKNRRITDTAFMIGHVYLKLYPSLVFVYLKHVCTRNQPQTLQQNVGLISTTIKKPDRLCHHLLVSLKS